MGSDRGGATTDTDIHWRFRFEQRSRRLALPREAREAGKIQELRKGLGKNGLIVLQCFSRNLPKHILMSWPAPEESVSERPPSNLITGGCNPRRRDQKFAEQENKINDLPVSSSSVHPLTALANSLVQNADPRGNEAGIVVEAHARRRRDQGTEARDIPTEPLIKKHMTMSRNRCLFRQARRPPGFICRHDKSRLEVAPICSSAQST